MKKFVFNLLLFTAPIILLGYGIDNLISENLRKSNYYAQKEYPTWNAILGGNLDADVLVYGSSRAWVHFDTKIMADSLHQSVYNLGIDGHNFNLQYLRHLLALKNNKKPKLILHSVDIGTLSKGDLYNPDQFLPYMLWNDVFYDGMSKYEGYTYLDYKIPLVRYYGKVDALKAAIKMIAMPKNNAVERIRGYQGQDKPWNNDFERAKKTMQNYAPKPDSLLLNQFDNYLKACKAQNIAVILVYAPYYIEGQAFMQNQNQTIETYKILAHKHGFAFMDFTKDEICTNKKYFYNASHLNKMGAERFTRKLCTQIKNKI